jgi:hypothetical protein
MIIKENNLFIKQGYTDSPPRKDMLISKRRRNQAPQYEA